jgi:MFS family permease
MLFTLACKLQFVFGGFRLQTKACTPGCVISMNSETLDQFMRKSRALNWRRAFSAMQHRNYRLWFLGQIVSLFGTWMQSTAQGYFIFQLTRSPAYLGYLAFANGLPSWLFMLYAGVIADRIPRRTMLIITQTGMMLLAFILAILTFTHVVQPWHIVLLSFLLGIATAFDAPPRQAFVLEMVTREDLTNAIALNSAMFNSALALGPAFGGLVYAWVGPGWCFILNGISFIAVITALGLMHLKAQPSRPHHTSALMDFREGLQYVRNHDIIRLLMGLVAVASLFGYSFVTLLPAWAVNILGGDARTNGLLMSARGVGALFSALGLASLGHLKIKGKLLTIGTFLFPLGILLFAVLHTLPWALGTLLIAGMANILVLNSVNALIQTAVDDQLRGRVMGIYTFILFGVIPIGGLLAGIMAEHFGLPATILLNGIIALAAAILIWIFFPRLRQLQ